MKLKFQLIDNWRDAFRMTSNIATTALGMLTLIQTDLLPFIQPLFTPTTFTKVVGVMAVLTFICRLVKQPALHPEPEPARDAQAQGGA